MAEQSNETFDVKSWDPPNLSIPKSECINKYYEFISCLCMVEQNNELLIENHETCLIGFASFP